MQLFRLLTLPILTLVLRGVLLCQVSAEEELVRQLDSPESRELFLSRLSPEDKVTERRLLTILESQRGQLEKRFQKRSLLAGMADAFGVLGTKEAIPWLIANITLWRYDSPTDLKRWLRRSETIEYDFPAVRALVRIGPEALDALIQSYYYKPLDRETRLAIVFALSRIHNPRTKQLLKSVQYDINQLQQFVNEGLALPASGEDVKK